MKWITKDVEEKIKRYPGRTLLLILKSNARFMCFYDYSRKQLCHIYRGDKINIDFKDIAKFVYITDVITYLNQKGEKNNG